MCDSIIADSRQRFAIIKGIVICVGYLSEEWPQDIPEMEIPYSEEFLKTVERLEQRGYIINYKWKK